MNRGDFSQAKTCSRVKVALAILGSLCFAFPLTAMLWFHASPLPMANESLAYRFMLSERILHGEGATAWIWQGQFTSAIQTTELAVINLFSLACPAQLESRVRLFAFFYLAVVSAACASTLFIAARLKTVNAAGMVLLVLSAGGPVFLTRVIGFYYFNLPDYLVLNALLAVIALLLFQHWWAKPETDSSRGIVEASFGGLMLGLMTANKVTMIVVGAMPIVALVLRPQVKWQDRLIRAAAMAIAASGGFFFVFLWLYRFDAHAAATAVRLLLGSVHDLSKPESGFWIFEFRTYLTGYSYSLIIGFYLATALIAALPIWPSERPRRIYYLMLGTLFLAGIAWTCFLGMRPAGTTFFEAVVAWMILGCMALSMIRQSLRGSLLILFIFGVAVMTADVTFSPRFGDLRNGLRESTKQDKDLWRVYYELLEFACGRETIVIIPDNTYAYYGVPEFLLKGTADFPTWSITSHGRPTLECYAHRLSFRSDYVGDVNNPYPPNAVLFWVDLPENVPIEQRCVYLKVLSLQKSLRRKSWVIPTGATRLLSAYAVQTPSEPVQR
jgi:hypothetical protein